MSSARSAPPLILSLRRSRYLSITLGALHLLALASLAMCSLPLGITIPIGIAVIISLALNLACASNSRSRRFIDQVCGMADGQWQLRTGDGVEHSVRLLSSYAHPAFVILRFKGGRFSWRSVVLLPDSADPDEIRRLRIWLRTSQRDGDRPHA